MKMKYIAAAAALLCMSAALTGCGKKTFDVSKELEVSFSGYNGYGTCVLNNQYGYVEHVLDWYGDRLDGMQKAKAEMELDDAVTYTITPSDHLSNGDTVTVTPTISSAAEEWAFRLKGDTITVTVEGLDEVETFDPFDGVSLVYEGIAPNGTARVQSESNDNSVKYTLDKSSGLSNGNTVVVTAEYPSDEDRFAQQYGKIFSETEKEFTVEGLSSYAMSIEEIPEDMMAKMLTQAEDSIRANAAGWDEGNTIKEAKHLGDYFLSVKEGFDANPKNMLFCVYEITANMTGFKEQDTENKVTGEETYYTYYLYSDIMLLPDGTASVDLSAGRLNDHRTDSTFGYLWFGWNRYRFDGYADLDSMFNECVTKKIENYNYVNTVK